ncbi:MAG: hypothetical protein GXY55_09795 [Phycisphaerae bacterium]|nr:hypothetical protein [Phycisphaerae bacterium]
MELIAIWLVVLSIVVLVGHGIWVLGAWLLRGMRPRERARFEPTLSDDRAATSRYLDHLRSRGLLDHKAHAKMLRLMADEVKTRPGSHVFRAAPPASIAQPTAEGLADAPIAQPREQIPLRASPTKEAVAATPPTERPIGDLREPAPAAPVLELPPAIPAEPARPPRRAVGEVLAAFMAEKNIRWGELIGGLLILGCSTALVISLWSHIEAIPTLKFLIFTAVTAGLFGVGLFVHHRWKLPTTGHAVLIISSLLVPLNFLAFAALSVRDAAISPWTLGIEVATLLVFGWLALLAGRALLSGAAWLFAGGIVTMSACSLVVRSLSPLSDREMVGVAALPVCLYVLVLALHLWRHRRTESLDEAETRGIFLQLGVQTFACLVPLGLILSGAGQVAALRLLSPLLSALAGPGLITGCFLTRRIDRKAPGQVHTIALGIALVAAAVMLLGVGMAWPMPARLMIAVMVNALAVFALGRVAPHAAFHGLTAAWLAAAWVLGVHLAGDAVSWSTNDPRVMVAALLSAKTAQALIVPFVICLLGAEWFNRRRFREAALGYGMAALALAVVSVGLMTGYGFRIPGDPGYATWVYLLYAVASFATGWRLREARITWTGCVLLQAALVQALTCAWPVEQLPWATALLAGSSLCTAAVVLLRAVRARPEILHIYGVPLAQFSVVVSLAAAGLMAHGASAVSADVLALRLGWLAGLWMVLAAVRGWPELFAGSQIALLLAACAIVQHHLVGQAWYPSTGSPLVHPWVWQAHLLTAGGLCLLWSLCRLAVTRRQIGVSEGVLDNPQPQNTTPLHQQVDSVRQGQLPSVPQGQLPSVHHAWLSRARGLLDPPLPSADRGIGALALLGLLVLAGWSVWPAAIAEHGWKAIPVIDRLHTHAAEIGSWLVLGILAVTFGVHVRQGYHRLATLGLLLVTAAGFALLAARFEAQQQVVHAWRWLSAVGFLIGAVVFWLARSRGLLTMMPVQIGTVAAPADAAACTASEPSIEMQTQQRWQAARSGLNRQSCAPLDASSVWLWLLLILAMPVLLLTASFLAAMGWDTALLGMATQVLSLRFWLLGPAILVGLTLLGHAIIEKDENHAVAAVSLTCAVVTATEACLAVRSGLGWSYELVFWLVQLNAIIIALTPAVWAALRMTVDLPASALIYPRWLLLIARTAVGMALLAAVGGIWMFPSTGPLVAEAMGTWWGLLALALVEWGLFAADREFATGNMNRDAGTLRRSHRESVWVLFGIAMLGCALAPLDTGNWVCFHTLMVGLVVAGGLRLWAGSFHLRGITGGGWQETFATASARASGDAGPIDHDLSCSHCSYNLRGLLASGLCPECGQPIATAVDAAVRRLTPQWTAMLSQIRSQVISVVLACTIVATLFALRASMDDPQKPWWSSGVLVALAALVMGLALWAPRKALAYLGGIHLCLAASISWIALHWQSGTTRFADELSNLVHVNVIALAAAGIGWLLAQRAVSSQSPSPATKTWWPPFHSAAAILSVGLTSLAALAALVWAATSDPLDDSAITIWMALATTAALLVGSRLDPAFRWAAPGLYVLGLAGFMQVMAQSGMAPRSLTWAMSLALAGYTLGTSVIWRLGARRDQEAAPASLPDAWLPAANGLLTLIALLLAGAVALTHPEFDARVLVVGSPLLCAIAAIVLVPVVRPAAMQTPAAGLLTATAILFAWAWVSPDAPAPNLHRAVGVVAAVVAAIVAAGIATFRIPREHAWATAIRSCIIAAGSAAGAALLFCSGSQALQLVDGQASELLPAAVIAMIAALAVMIVCCVLFAVRERFDPLHLTEGGREAYVYLGEILAALLALHVRATMPWLFSGIVTQYWPMLVMALAFAAAIISEVCGRQGQKVLARPLGWTAVLLPCVAAIDLFLQASRVHGSFVLLVIGGFYIVLAGLRRSARLATLAGFAFTGSLWYLLYQTPGLGITQHPQLWFIPPSLAVLAAGHLSRHRLTDQQARLMHYGCLLAVYLSSTADIFLIGVAHAPWLPLVLGGLSVAGIFVGIAARVRSFLMLGTGFLCLALFTMIWHAAANLGWTWVWYVAGIALGAAIITVFALFERKRNEMNAWLGQMRSWRE